MPAKGISKGTMRETSPPPPEQSVKAREIRKTTPKPMPILPAESSVLRIYYRELGSASGLRPVKKSRVISKLSQLDAMLGATLSKLGTMPLYRPRSPSWLTMTRTASMMPLYWYPMPDMVLIWNRRRSTSLPRVSGGVAHVARTVRLAYKGYVHVCATAPEMAPAASFRAALGCLSPSGVRYFRTDS